MYKIKKQELIKLTGIIILLLALPASVYLTKHTQIFKPKAHEANYSHIDFPGLSGEIPTTTSQNVRLQLNYGTGSPPFPTPSPTLTASSGDCGINLQEGQRVSGDLAIRLTANRTSPAYYLSLFVYNSRQGNFQGLSSQSNILFANISTSSLFANGPGAIECRIQTEPGGGTIISSNRVNVNVTN